MNVASKPFGKTASGETVTIWTLTNRAGNMAKVTDYGASIVSVSVPDRQGKLANVNIGFDNAEAYQQKHPHFGGTIGRFCNRIAAGKFTLDGKTYSLAINNGPNHLHGGLVGFDHLMWKGEAFESANEVGVRFKLRSPDGQENYPGNLDVISEFSWNDQNELKLSYVATTDAPTHVNLTNHAYWNLGGMGSGQVLQHVVKIEADQVLDVDDGLIPTGKLNEVAGSVLDFRKERTLGQSIHELPATKGYDHCFVVRGNPGTLRPAAMAHDPVSGRTMEVFTTQPGVQLYTGNHLQGDERCAGQGQYAGFCFETQHYPDAPNKPMFKTTLLKPGETLREVTVLRFGVK